MPQGQTTLRSQRSTEALVSSYIRELAGAAR
jgi:hypothetical protein